MLKKNQMVVKVLRCAGHETATIEVIESVSKGVASLRDSSLKFDAKTLQEHDPAPGFGPAGISCRLITFDDGEEKRWKLNKP